MERISDIFGLMLFFNLNPITWAIVIALAIWTKHYWKPAVAGVLTQLACPSLFILYMDFSEGSESFEDLLSETSTVDILSFFAVCVLSGITIAALVILFVRQRRLQRQITANA